MNISLIKKSMLMLVGASLLQLSSIQAQNFYYGYGASVGSFATIPASFTSLANGTVQEVPSDRIVMPGIGIALDKPLAKIGSDAGIGIHANPSLSYPFSTRTVSVPNGGYITARPIIHAPLLLTVGYGAFSHAGSERDFGFSLGLGMHAQYIIESLSATRSAIADASGKTFLAAPAVRASVHFWSPGNQLMALSLTHALASESFAGQTVNRSATTLNFALYFNY